MVSILTILFDCSFSETIFGYKDLRVEMFCSAAKMTTYVGIKYLDKIDPKTCDGVQVSDSLVIWTYSNLCINRIDNIVKTEKIQTIRKKKRT